jgi:hypothetical protein
MVSVPDNVSVDAFCAQISKCLVCIAALLASISPYRGARIDHEDLYFDIENEAGVENTNIPLTTLPEASV